MVQIYVLKRVLLKKYFTKMHKTEFIDPIFSNYVNVVQFNPRLLSAISPTQSALLFVQQLFLIYAQTRLVQRRQ